MMMTRRSTLAFTAAALAVLSACKFPVPPDVGDDAVIAVDASSDAPVDASIGPTFARAYGSPGTDFGTFVAATDQAVVFGGVGGAGFEVGGIAASPYFIARTSAGGQPLSALAWPSPFRDAAFDRFGNLYVVGELDGAASAGGAVLTSVGQDVFVAKFDATGRHLWSRAFGGAGAQVGERIAIASDDDIVICGEFAGATRFGGSPLVEHGGWDVFVARLSRSDGSLTWSMGFGGSNEDTCSAAVAAADGTIVVLGAFFGNMTVNGASLPVAGSFDIFAVGLGASGSVRWSHAFGSAGADRVANGALADQGDVLVAGSFAGDLTLGTTLLHPQARDDGFVARMSTDGIVAWATPVSGSDLEYVTSVSSDGDRVVVSGVVAGPTRVGEVMVSPPVGNGTDIFVATLRYANGSVLAARTYGGSGPDGVIAETTVSEGTLILTGGFSSPSFDFGPGLTVAGTGSDTYIARVPLP